MATQTEKTSTKERAGEGNVPARAKQGALARSHRSGMMQYGWEPFRQMRQEFDRLFDQLFGGTPALWEGAGGGTHWGLDVHEDDKAVTVRAEAPGFEPDDFDIQVRGDHLILSATHKAESEEIDRGYREWRRHEFYRSVPLPPGITADKVEANYRQGVLSVTMPLTEASRGRRITVRG